MDFAPSKHNSREGRGESIDEERKALLPEDTEHLEEVERPHWIILRPVVESLALCVVFFFIGYLLTPPLLNALIPPPRTQPPKDFFDNQKLRSNGTHDFKRTALIVSIDGLRYAVLESCRNVLLT